MTHILVHFLFTQSCRAEGGFIPAKIFSCNYVFDEQVFDINTLVSSYT